MYWHILFLFEWARRAATIGGKVISANDPYLGVFLGPANGAVILTSNGKTMTNKQLLPPGTTAPNYTLNATPDQSLSLSDLKGRPVVLAY